MKITGHYSLFAGSIYGLSTERHKLIFSQLDDLSVLGCFCLTEIGFGNNTIQMETTATYDPLTKELIINSPTTLSKKFLMANGGCHATMAVVFAQTIVNGQNEGVNAILVKLRESDRTLSKGVQIEDIGQKMEMNGLDNAKITFHHVRVPYTNLLNKYSDIDPITNTFISSINKKRDRFTRAINELTGGRLCIIASTLGASKLVLLIALRYSKKRIVEGSDGKNNVPIFDYQLQKLSLIPLLAQLVSCNVAFNRIKDIYADPNIIREEKSRLCCILKPLAVYLGERIASVCRERCEEQGLLSVNRIEWSIGTFQGAITGEGDNVVMFQKVTKELLSDLSSGLIQLPQMKNKINQLQYSSDLTDLRDFLVFREIFLINKLQNTLAKGLGEGKTIFQI